MSVSGLEPSSASDISGYFFLSSKAAGHSFCAPTIVLHSSCEAPKPGRRMTGVLPHSSGLVACRVHPPSADCMPKIRSSATRLTGCGAASHVFHAAAAWE